MNFHKGDTVMHWTSGMGWIVTQSQTIYPYIDIAEINLVFLHYKRSPRYPGNVLTADLKPQ